MLKDKKIKYTGDNSIINKKNIMDIFNINVSINKIKDEKIMIVKED